MKFAGNKRRKRFLAVGLVVALIVTAFSIVAAAQTRASQKTTTVTIRWTTALAPDASATLKTDKPATYNGYPVTYSTRYGAPFITIDLGEYNVSLDEFQIPSLSTFCDLQGTSAVDYVSTHSGDKKEGQNLLLFNGGNELVYYLKGSAEPEKKTATVHVYGRGEAGAWTGPTQSNPRTYTVELDQSSGYGDFTLPALASAGFSITDPSVKFAHCTTPNGAQQPGTSIRLTEGTYSVIYEFQKKAPSEIEKDFMVQFVDSDGTVIPDLSYTLHFQTYGTKVIDDDLVYQYLAEKSYIPNPKEQSYRVTYSGDGTFDPQEVKFQVTAVSTYH
ncbi:hypothetical protein [Clostridium sp. D33t1_170424_F3]|uniref:hypothetical protein n=1 Tax=Clostridium sp. D33t1_170424_F3 TaxID=2787099 RepID=UPI0018AC2A7C|nr:hypothetical protein [Clostridium sp. D33t1_170424_F3]